MVIRKLAKFLAILAVVSILWIVLIRYAERTRTIEGTWLDLFEGSSFFEGQTLAEACSGDGDDAPWFAYYPNKNTPQGAFLRANRNSGWYLSKYGTSRVSAYSVKFVGRRKVSKLLGLAPSLGVGYGHLASFGSEYEVDRVIMLRLIPDVICDTRSPR